MDESPFGIITILPVVAPNKGVDMAELNPGDPAPEFNLAREDGGTSNLASFSGKKLVLYFYPRDDTSGCTTEAIDFSRLKPAFERAGAVVIGISPDSAAKHAKFKEKRALTVELVPDEQREIIEAFGVWVEKSLYGRRYMGVERASFLIGPDGRIANVWRKVKVKGHAEAVLEAVQAL